MTFYSILFKRTEDVIKDALIEAPSFFIDLNLEQIINTVTSGKDEYNLKPFFYTPLKDMETILYRQDIMQDIENKILFKQIKSFSRNMWVMRGRLAQADELNYKYHKGRLFIEAVKIYCDLVDALTQNLSFIELKSYGFLAFRKYLANYVKSVHFLSLIAETKNLLTNLTSIKYCIHIKDNAVTVGYCESGNDYSMEVQHAFEKFKQDVAKKPEDIPYSSTSGFNHIEAQILDRVAKLYPDTFKDLDDFFAKNNDFLDETITVFDREVQFYIAYLEYIELFKKEGLKFCYPQITNEKKEVFNYEGFDLTLAYTLIKENRSSIVCNDFYMKDKERIIVVSGPNQGGKTTFARTFGQLHYLASLGCPVPGSKSQLFLFDKLFSHFENEEKLETLRGKLQDDLIRINSILNQSTSNSIIIMNEILTSTTLQDATYLSKKIMNKIVQLGLLCVWVSFIDELASFSESTVSMMSTVVPENPSLRTFKIIRMPANNLAYAISIAEKYQLTYDCIKERIKL